MEFIFAIIGIILSTIWWYKDLYKLIVNFKDKLFVKNKLINMCISTIINIILLIFIIYCINH